MTGFPYSPEGWLEGLTPRKAASRRLGAALAAQANAEGYVQLGKTDLDRLGSLNGKERHEAILDLTRAGLLRVVRREEKMANVYRLIMGASRVTTSYREPKRVAGGPTKVYRFDASTGAFVTVDPIGTAHRAAA